MGKTIRIGFGAVLVTAGVVLFILPGSILFLLGGLLLLSYDVPKARQLLQICQNNMSRGARRLDRFILNRKFR